MIFGPEFPLTELSPALGASGRQEGEPQQWCRGGRKAGGLADKVSSLLDPSAETRDKGSEWGKTLGKVAWRSDRAIRVWKKDRDKEYKERERSRRLVWGVLIDGYGQE